MSTNIATTCSVPIAALISAPYSLDWGVSVYAKVVAINLYGDSLESVEGNNAIISTSPDKPIDLAENYA